MLTFVSGVPAVEAGRSPAGADAAGSSFETEMTTIERVLAWLLAVSGALHVMGTFTGYPAGSEIFIWSLAATLAVFLLVALNLMRINRPQDRTLAAVSAAGCIVWALLALGFGHAVGNIADPRALIHAVLSAALAACSIRTMLRAA